MSAARQSVWPDHCRTALAQAIERAARQFPCVGEDEATRVHEARRALKSAAALARLLSGLVGTPADEALKTIDAARKAISRARDLDVLPGVLAKIDPPAKVRSALLAAIAEQREKARRAHRDNDVTVTATELSALATAVGAWDIEAADAAPLLAATRAAYRAARRKGEAAVASREAGALHAFRGRVIDLACQLAVFEPAWPAMMSAFTRELQRMRAALGDHNDLTMLAVFVRDRPELTAAEADAVIALVRKRQQPLERRAARLYARLFSERPADFERRLSAYLAHPSAKSRAR